MFNFPFICIDCTGGFSLMWIISLENRDKLNYGNIYSYSPESKQLWGTLQSFDGGLTVGEYKIITLPPIKPQLIKSKVNIRKETAK